MASFRNNVFQIVLLFTVVIGDINFDIKAKSSDNYGPYDVTSKIIELCRGPKTLNISTIDSKNIVQDNETTKIEITFKFLKDAQYDEIKIFVFSLKGGRKFSLWNYKVPNPCQHFLFSEIIQNALDNKNCVAKKGSIVTFHLDYVALAHMFLGESFFYGTYHFKAYVLSKKGNIACLIFETQFKKKT